MSTQQDSIHLQPRPRHKGLRLEPPLWYLDLGLPGPPELGYGWKVLVALSVTVQKERPQERPAASRP